MAFVIDGDVESYQSYIEKYMTDHGYTCFNDEYPGWRYYKCGGKLEWDPKGVTRRSQSAFRVLYITNRRILVIHYGGGVLTSNTKKLVKKYCHYQGNENSYLQLKERPHSHLGDKYIRDNMDKWMEYNVKSEVKSGYQR
jgi:hypothetical protein